MANDLYINPLTGDLDIGTDTGSLYLCPTVEALTRQRIEITLRTYLGEWFYNTEFGTPYFEEIFGKNRRTSADIAIRTTVLNVEGVNRIIDYRSILYKDTRTLTVTMTIETDSGEILPIEVTL